MKKYFDVQIMNSSKPIHDYEIELKIEHWQQRHSNAHVLKTEIEKYENSYDNYSIFLVITYEANSRVPTSVSSKKIENYLHNYPGNSNASFGDQLDGSKGIGYVARENGKFGSFPMHDDYSEES